MDSPALVPWEDVELHANSSGIGDGSFETRKAFTDGLRLALASSSCKDAWTPPAGLTKIEVSLELRIITKENRAIVSDVLVVGGNLSDSGLESCLIRRHKGLEVEVPGLEPNQQTRMKWPFISFYGPAEGLPSK